MIHLDANYLISGSRVGSKPAAELQHWLEQDEMLATSAIAWMEFVTGPVTPELIDSIRHAISGRIVAFGHDEAELAADLFNFAGRKRSLRYDCMIAAVAVNAGAQLATLNRQDFQIFVPHGLDLAR